MSSLLMIGYHGPSVAFSAVVFMIFRSVLFSVSALFFFTQTGASMPLTIHMAEQAGFQRVYQPFYQLVGAVDGWSGEWAGEEVELYQFASGHAADVEAFEALVLPGNSSGWVQLCKGKNLIMLSKGEAACAKLQAVAEN